MTVTSRFPLMALMLAVGCRSVPDARAPIPATDYWPTTVWLESTPEAQGVSSGALADAVAFAHAHLALHGLLIVRHGRIVLDAAFYPYRAGDRHDMASVTKSITSLLIGAAERRHQLERTDRLGAILPEASDGGDPRRAAITLESLLAMESGLDCGFRNGQPELEAMTRSADWVRAGVAIPMRSRPGTEMGYCSVNYHLLSAVLSRVTGSSEAAFARQVLFGPLGITDVYWPADPQGRNHGWGDLQLRPRDAAKIGFLMLHGGRWDGGDIVSSEWVAWSTAPHAAFGTTDVYAHGWWTHRPSPKGFFEAVGRGGQRISVWPAKDVVIVETGGGFEPGDLTSFLLRALASDSPLPTDPAAEARLRANVAGAAAGPSAQPVPPVPAIANTISGRTYVVEPNSAGLGSIGLQFAPGSEATATVGIAGRRLRLPVGLDGVYRLSADTIETVHPAAKGAWTSADEFTLDLDLVGKINRYAIRLRFGDAGRTVHVHLEEATGTSSADAMGRWVP